MLNIKKLDRVSTMNYIRDSHDGHRYVMLQVTVT